MKKRISDTKHKYGRKIEKTFNDKLDEFRNSKLPRILAKYEQKRREFVTASVTKEFELKKKDFLK